MTPENIDKFNEFVNSIKQGELSRFSGDDWFQIALKLRELSTQEEREWNPIHRVSDEVRTGIRHTCRRCGEVLRDHDENWYAGAGSSCTVACEIAAAEHYAKCPPLAGDEPS
jgi:hypothetical protein